MSSIPRSNHQYGTASNFYPSMGKLGGTPSGTKVSKSPGVSKHLAQTCKVYSTRAKTPKSKSVDPTLSKNQMLSSFVRGEGYGFNYYLNDNEVNVNSKMSKTQNNFNPKREDQTGEEIDKLLNYYMKELNNSNFQINFKISEKKGPIQM